MSCEQPGPRNAHQVATASTPCKIVTGQRNNRSINELSQHDRFLKMEATMPILLWLLGVPLIVVIALMLTHVI